MIHVWPQEPRAVEDTIELRGLFEGASGKWEVWYRVPAETQSWLTSQADPFVVAGIFLGMQSGEGLAVHGQVSPSLLENLEEFQSVWNCWRPEKYRVVPLQSDREAEPARRGENLAVASYSGGLDANHTVYSHIKGLRGRRSKKIGAAVMAHGFDLPLERDEAFELALESGRAALRSVNVPLYPLKTNWRSLPLLWEDVFPAAAASCLSLFAAKFDCGLFAGGEAHGDLGKYLPWGSNPVTNPLLSSASFRFTYDCGELNRVQKAEQLLGWPQALERLRVCWEGPKTGRNCGKCEKCVRTILDFRAVGGGCPPSFPADVTSEQIRALRLRNRVQFLEMANVCREAERRGLQNEKWVREVKAKLVEFEEGGTPKPIHHRALSALRRVLPK